MFRGFKVLLNQFFDASRLTYVKMIQSRFGKEKEENKPAKIENTTQTI